MTDGTGEAVHYATADDLGMVRAFVANRAQRLGLPADRVDLLTLAVCELATNTLQHSGGSGRIRVFADAGQVLCDVVDSGPVPVFGRGMPAAQALRGRGLAIVERVCDSVHAYPVAEGTLVRIGINL